MNCRHLSGSKGTHFCSISRTHSRLPALVSPCWLGNPANRGTACLSLVAYLVKSCGAATAMASLIPLIATFPGPNRSAMLNYWPGKCTMWSDAPRSSLFRIQVKGEPCPKGPRWDAHFSNLLTVFVGRMILRKGGIRASIEERARDWQCQGAGQTGRTGLGRRERE